MKKSKLLRIVKAFDAKELRRLNAFLISLYFYPRGIPDDELALFKLLCKQSPHFPDAQLEKEKVFQQLYPDRLYTDGVLDKKMSSLLKRIEHFIHHEDLVETQTAHHHLMSLSRFFRKKKLTNLYEINLGHLQKKQKGMQQKGLEGFLQEYQIQQEINEYRSMYSSFKDDFNLSNTLRALKDFYLASKLYYTCCFWFQNLFHTRIDPPEDSILLENTNLIKAQESFAKLPMIKVFTLMFILLQKIKEGKFERALHQELEKWLAHYEDRLPLKLVKELQAFCRSFYLRQFVNGDNALLEKVYALYRAHLEKGYLFYDGGLHPVIYRNIVSYGLKLKEFDWTYLFIEKYKDQIVGTNNPKDLYHFNLADYYFRIKNYEAAKNLLKEHYKDLVYQIIAKRLEIKIYYEEKSPILESKIDAFRLFLLRFSKKKELNSTKHFNSNNNFINALKQILHPKTYNNPTRIQHIRDKIGNTKIIAERDWLLNLLTLCHFQNKREGLASYSNLSCQALLESFNHHLLPYQFDPYHQQ